MTPDISKVDLILHYALLIAGEEDDYSDRQLGPIHLIKYVYLADLFHAQQRAGETYTGIEWQFYKFGPWSQTVNARIEPALKAIRAVDYRFESQFDDESDWVRWELKDDRLLEEKQKQLPVFVAPQLKRMVHRFGKDTPALLEFVYSTYPMLKAAPNEILDFSSGLSVQEPVAEFINENSLDNLSNKKRKVFAEKMKQLRSRLEKSHENESLINPVPNPRYDDIFDAGVEWLDSLAGEQMSSVEGTATFDNSVWKSKARNSDDIP